MNKTVYLLVVEWHIKSGEHGLDTTVYGNLEDARAEMAQQIKDARTDLSGEGYVEDSYVEGDNSFSRYAEGDWTGEHIDITIYEKDIL